ncbi:MAG: chloride channel protein [Bacteroidales bacterium]|nr:chloride channel protein [Bacteroidales bacterium]MCB8998479.1 chloride channel protein [Bacteroidales bacterium]
MVRLRPVFERIHKLRLKYIQQRQFILILSAVVGLVVGFSAVIIKNLVHFIQELLKSGLNGSLHYALLFILPIAGIFITVLFIRYINKKPVGDGVPSVLYAVSKKSGIMESHNMYSSVISSALTVGFGGSVGLEGPTVATGAALGSNIGRVLKLSYKEITLLLACASAGAMSAIFKAPIAGTVFALEVIMTDLTMAGLIPLLISSVTAALTSYFFLGQNVLYAFSVHEPFHLNRLVFYLIIGIVTGLVSVYFFQVYNKLSQWFSGIEKWHHRLLIGGGVLGILIFIFPALYGEGYQQINNMLAGNYGYLFENTFYSSMAGNIWIVLGLLSLLILFKSVALNLTFGAGGIGGIFAPTLFTGAATGLFFGLLMNKLGFPINPSNFALIGMAGLIAGVIHAPLTAIFLIAELTGGYELLMPIMISATISYATVRMFEKNSVYTVQLARRGALFTHDKDKNVLLMMSVNDLIETNFNKIHPEDKLGYLVKVITSSHRNIFPVVDAEDNFMGIVKLDDIRQIIFKTKLYNKTLVKELMFTPQFTISPDEPMEEVVHKFTVSGRFNIAVIKDGKYLGFVSRAKVFSAYRDLVHEISEE